MSAHDTHLETGLARRPTPLRLVRRIGSAQMIGSVGAAGAVASAEAGARGERRLTGSSVADLLGLAAAPTFAMMALLTALLGAGVPDMICASAAGGWPLGGMVPMYLLMSAFHTAPWLRLIARRG
jgi:hypothetical protein